MSVRSDNERRIRNGRRIFKAYCDLRNLPPVERREEYTATDLIVDLCHFAKRKGWDPEGIFRSAADHLEQETVETCRFCERLVTHEWAETEEDAEGNTIYFCSPSCKSLQAAKEQPNG